MIATILISLCIGIAIGYVARFLIAPFKIKEISFTSNRNPPSKEEGEVHINDVLNKKQ